MHFREWISLPKVIFFQRNNSLLHQRKVYRSLIHLRQLNHRIVWFFKFRISKNPGFFPIFRGKNLSFREGKQHPLTFRVFPMTLPFAGIVSPCFFLAANTHMLKLKLYSSHWDGDELSNWKKTSVLKNCHSEKKKTGFQQQNDKKSTKNHHLHPPCGERIFFMTSPASKPDSSANLRSNFLVDP